MTRAAVQQAIEFRGLIEGCADHQWLLTDALYHSGEEPSPDGTPRWIIQSDIIGRPTSSAEEKIRNHFVAHDRKAGWTLTASSATALAKRIQRQCCNSSQPSLPS